MILILWGACFAWTIPYCYLYGYTTPENSAELSVVLGMPAWVVWGVAVPWLVAGLISIALCLWFIQDDDLGHAADEQGK